MQEQTEYEVWKLVENQGRCYASTDCVGGVTLAAYLKHHPVVPQELLLRWMKEIPRELEKFHRCRGNPCFQYVNPFSIIIGPEGTVHLLNLESGKQKEVSREKITSITKESVCQTIFIVWEELISMFLRQQIPRLPYAGGTGGDFKGSLPYV